MSGEKNWLGLSASVASAGRNPKPLYAVVRAFGGLKVRQKLAVLHNIFFLVLAISVYLSLIPLFSEHFQVTAERERQLYTTLFATGMLPEQEATTKDMPIYQLRKGSARELGVPADAANALEKHLVQTWTTSPGTVFRADTEPGAFLRLQFSSRFYDEALRRARINLLGVLATIYLLAVCVLEFLIMPEYVYQPLTLMLQADMATQADDREHEMIDDHFILNDEIGQIMRSRNATVAQLRRQEDSLASALRRLEEQDRLVSLGLLSTSVAHELNTPLAVLQGSIEKLQETTGDTVALERLDRMLRVTQRLRKISESLVDFARVRSNETERVELRPLVDESWSLVAIDEKASAVMFSNEVNEAEAVIGNADRLIQVFVNLLRNALLAVGDNGCIRIEAKRVLRNGEQWVCCSVLDNGPGIPPELLGKLFEAFVSTRLDARGTGLGLTVAEGIVNQHGGSITASNQKSGGAALEVWLPAA